MTGDLHIRPATAADLPHVAAIYHYYVLNATCTFETEPRSEAAWEDWLAEHSGAHPAIVAERDGEIVGWASLSRWNNRCAYRFSVENSVYVKPECHRQGIGLALLEELVGLARRHGHRCVVAQIADHQAASEAVHERVGFRRVGGLRRVGHKFDRWIDVVIFQLLLDDDDAA